MYAKTEKGEIFIHSEPGDNFLRVVRREKGKLKQYCSQYWHQDKYDNAEAWLRGHAQFHGYEIVENNELSS